MVKGKRRSASAVGGRCSCEPAQSWAIGYRLGGHLEELRVDAVEGRYRGRNQPALFVHWLGC